MASMTKEPNPSGNTHKEESVTGQQQSTQQHTLTHTTPPFDTPLILSAHTRVCFLLFVPRSASHPDQLSSEGTLHTTRKTKKNEPTTEEQSTNNNTKQHTRKGERGDSRVTRWQAATFPCVSCLTDLTTLSSFCVSAVDFWSDSLPRSFLVPGPSVPVVVRFPVPPSSPPPLWVCVPP